MKKDKQKVFVLSAPSGTGKTTVCGKILNRDKRIRQVCTMTTRKPREGEKNGRDYYFITPGRFNQYVKAGKFLEYADVHGEQYGTPKQGVAGILSRKKDVMLVIDVQGGLSVKKAIPGSVLIFLKPPSIHSLRERLDKRGLDTEKVKKERLRSAQKEMKTASQYDHIVINRYVSKAVDGVLRIIKKERKKTKK